MSQGFARLSIEGITPEEGAPAPDMVISGNPTNLTWNLEEADGNIFAGVWEATPGKWRLEYTEWEYCHILSGVSIITEDGGEPNTVRAGDSFFLKPGFKGTWEVVETTRKEYVIRE